MANSNRPLVLSPFTEGEVGRIAGQGLDRQRPGIDHVAHQFLLQQGQLLHRHGVHLIPEPLDGQVRGAQQRAIVPANSDLPKVKPSRLWTGPMAAQDVIHSAEIGQDTNRRFAVLAEGLDNAVLGDAVELIGLE